MPTPPITLAAVEYLNTLPLIHSIDRWADCTIQTAVPAQIAGLVLNDQADLGLISLIDAARHPDQLALIPCSMIGCDGPTMTVVLCSSVEPSSITAVHADTESHTSVVLADLVLRELHNTRAEFIDHDFSNNSAPDHAADHPETVLMIGDKVITNPPPESTHPYRIDLGEAWKTLTGLPFVYAVWMCKADRADDPRILLAASMLERVYRRNTMRLDHLITSEAHRRGWPADTARTYLGELLRFAVDDRAKQAAELFLSKAADAGLVPSVQPRWVDYAIAQTH